jgi:Coiled-coil domain-containing protein 50  N-terminus
LEDGALAHQLQDQESNSLYWKCVTIANTIYFILVAAHYGNNRVRNQIVRQDTPKARKEQEEELQQALALQKLQQQLREQQ